MTEKQEAKRIREASQRLAHKREFREALRQARARKEMKGLEEVIGKVVVVPTALSQRDFREAMKARVKAARKAGGV